MDAASLGLEMIFASSLLFNCWEFATRHPGILLVLLGVAGEVVFDWKEMKGRLAWAKRLSALVLIAGLILEFSEAAKSDNEVADTKERTALVESNNLVLRSNVVALELKIQPRTITGIQREKFIKLLTDVPKCPIRIHCGNVDNETRNYANQLRGMLDAAGYNATNGVVFDLGNRVTTSHFSGVDLQCVITNLQNISPPLPYMNDIEPATFKEIMKAFKEIGIDVLDGVILPPQCFAKEYREQLIKQGYDYPNFLGFELVPGEIAIILNEKAY